MALAFSIIDRHRIAQYLRREMKSETPRRYTRSHELLERSLKIIPSGTQTRAFTHVLRANQRRLPRRG